MAPMLAYLYCYSIEMFDIMKLSALQATNHIKVCFSFFWPLSVLLSIFMILLPFESLSFLF